MGWSCAWELLLLALLEPGGALLCPHCSSGHCQLLPCPFPNATCRRTTMTLEQGGWVQVQEQAGCDVIGPPDMTLTFRSHGALLTLTERRGAGGESTPTGRGAGRPLLCPSCESSNGSCERPLAALPCPRPSDYCLDLSSHVGGQEGESRLRGCGRAGSCRGLLALDTGSGRKVALRCCRQRMCDTEAELLPPPSGLRCWGWDGPGTPPGEPQVVTCGGGMSLCGIGWSYGPSGQSWLLRGCVSPGWCQTPVGLGGMWGSPIATPTPPGPTPSPIAAPYCCQGDFCNHLPGDPPTASAPQLPHSGLGLLLLLLSLWG